MKSELVYILWLILKPKLWLMFLETISPGMTAIPLLTESLWCGLVLSYKCSMPCAVLLCLIFCCFFSLYCSVSLSSSILPLWRDQSLPAGEPSFESVTYLFFPLWKGSLWEIFFLLFIDALLSRSGLDLCVSLCCPMGTVTVRDRKILHPPA